MRLQQAEDFSVQLGVIAGRAVEVGHLLVWGQIEQGVEHGIDALVAIGRGWGHRYLQAGHDASKMRSHC